MLFYLSVGVMGKKGMYDGECMVNYILKPLKCYWKKWSRHLQHFCSPDLFQPNENDSPCTKCKISKYTMVNTKVVQGRPRLFLT